MTRSLPVAIEADESAQTVQDVFRLVSERMVDVIDLKITKLGGLRRFMQALRICEAGNTELPVSNGCITVPPGAGCGVTLAA